MNTTAWGKHVYQVSLRANAGYATADVCIEAASHEEASQRALEYHLLGWLDWRWIDGSGPARCVENPEVRETRLHSIAPSPSTRDGSRSPHPRRSGYGLYRVYLSAYEGDVYAKEDVEAEGPDEAEADVLRKIERGEVQWLWVDSGRLAERGGDVEVTGVELWEALPPPQEDGGPGASDPGPRDQPVADSCRPCVQNEWTWLREFLESWGIEPDDSTGIAWSVYCRMLEDAGGRYGSGFQAWLAAITGGVDGYYFLMPSSWPEIIRSYTARFE